MAQEEDKLAALEVARQEDEANEAARKAGYAAEDAATAAARQRADELHAGGEQVREAMKAELEAAIKKRDAEEAAMSPDAVAALLARVAMLEEMQKKAAEPPAPVAEPVVVPPTA
jgi:hypothetical protein